MKILTLEQIKCIENDMLKYFKSICKENNLRYYLIFGTLLGAIRHEGFIPWDDDIDIAMPRKDYLKLVDIMKKSKRYMLVSSHSNDKYTTPLPKIIDSKTVLIQNYGLVEKVQLGVYLDIFILDGLSNDLVNAKIHFHTMEKWHYYWYLSVRKFFSEREKGVKDIIKTILSVPFRVIGPYYFINKIDILAQKYCCEESLFWGTICYPTEGDKEIVPKEFYGDGAVYIFEGEEYIGPVKYHEYLTNYYNEYMKLPSEEERVSNHNYKCWWRVDYREGEE